jgi:hypothetical protein
VDAEPVAARQLAGHFIETSRFAGACLGEGASGDERNLREFVIADEAASLLKSQGHVAHNLLFDDSLDPLKERQLRLAVDKDPEKMEELAGFCGKPIGRLPDPFGCHGSFAEHFEVGLLNRLRLLGCHPNLIRTSDLYARGAYRPAIEMVLDRYEEILSFLILRFPGYNPQSLFYPICPDCGRIEGTSLSRIQCEWVEVECSACETGYRVAREELQGKLSWKLDCAARWAMFGVDAELFSKAYLEPTAGTYVVAQALSNQFFEGHEVTPILYGMVDLKRDVSYRLFASLPPTALRALLAQQWANDLTIGKERIVLEASRTEVRPGTSYLDFVRQILPGWLLDPASLGMEQMELLARGVAFSNTFLDGVSKASLPCPDVVRRLEPETARLLAGFLDQMLLLRMNCGTYGEFDEAAQATMKRMGASCKTVTRALREVTGLEKSLPTRRLLFTLPLEYVRMLAFVLDAYARAQAEPAQLAQAA